jgi:hypothetical protein
MKLLVKVKDFDDLNFSHFPVVEEGVYIVSAEDIETLKILKK